MLKTLENVASRYGISRREQDEFAAESQRRASEAQRGGRFEAEIVPVKARHVSEGIDEEGSLVVERAEGVRHGVTVEKLSTLRRVLENGFSTAGNS